MVRSNAEHNTNGIGNSHTARELLLVGAALGFHLSVKQVLSKFAMERQKKANRE